MNPHRPPLVFPNGAAWTTGVTGPTGVTKGLAALAVERADTFPETVTLVWEEQAPDVDPLEWLGGEMVKPAFYWRGRGGLVEYAGLGAANILKASGPDALADTCARADVLLDNCITDPSLPREVQPRFFGGFAFHPDAEREAAWPEFGDALLILPEALLACSEGRNRLMFALAVTPGETTESVIARSEDLSARYRSRRAATVTPFHAEDCVFESETSAPEWSDSVRTALQRIESGALNKIVLMRRLRIGGVDFPVWRVMKSLRKRAPSCFQFAFQPVGTGAFVGASPERLFHRRGDEVETECLAGTTVRGSDESADHALADELLASVKDKLEHYYVVEEMLHNLGDLCDRMDVGAQPHVVKLETLQHLLTSARGHLKPGTTTGEVLASLHPTPAVGGSPRDAALATIRELESESRGWYAGPVGWYGKDEADFAVAIRSALLTSDGALVFAGSGVVSGSTPEGEWQETENKAHAFLNALQ